MVNDYYARNEHCPVWSSFTFIDFSALNYRGAAQSSKLKTWNSQEIFDGQTSIEKLTTMQDDAQSRVTVG